MKYQKVSVVGLGYIGLPTAAILASRGLEVIGVDVSETAVSTINAGGIHIVEPDLDMIVKSAVTMGRLKATTHPEPAEAFLIAVPTPFKDDHSPDLGYIDSAAEAIAPVLQPTNLIILESTSPVGTTERLANILAKLRPDLTFPQTHGNEAQIRIAHCPERVLPGHVLQELVSNDRIIGGMSDKCVEEAIELYRTFVKGECIATNARTAELSKLTENAFRDVNIAFANELSLISDKLKIDVWELIALANRHPRVNILNPGPGVGGHCIAVDPWFIVHSAPELSPLIQAARKVNDGKPGYVLSRIKDAADQFKRPVIACLGLAFKADIDDLRESPALDITLELLKESDAEILIVEPNIKALPDKLTQAGGKLVNLQEALERANTVAILVDHREFKSVPLTQLNNKLVIDTRGILSKG